MTRSDFLRGWLLLTSQPWGKAYRSDLHTPSTEPSPAKIQAELYYKALSFAFAPAWVEVCEVMAAGDHWPSISQLKEALRHAKAQRPQAEQVAYGPEFITKEQFGLDLFDAIYAASAHQQCQQNATMFEGKGLVIRCQEERKKATGHYTALQDLLNKGTIPPNDVREILARYPC
jgi:hypothetical protein